MCDALVVLDHGRVIHQGDIADMLGQSDRWSVVVQGEATGLPALEHVDLGHGRVRLLVDGEAARDALLADLAGRHDCHLLSLEQDRQTLEQAFVRLLAGEEGA